MIGLTTPRECAATATIERGVAKSHGNAAMTNFTQLACARIATSISITAKRGNSIGRARLQRQIWNKVRVESDRVHDKCFSIFDNYIF